MKPPKYESPDWDLNFECIFDEVEDEEIQACAYWEFFRETNSGVDYPAWQRLSSDEKAKHKNRLLWLGNAELLTRFDEDENESFHAPFSVATNEEEEGDFEYKCQINFEYSDGEIIDEFKKWLKNHRSNKPILKTKGKKDNSYRARLRGLGIMRVLYYHTPHEVKILFPKFYSKIQDTMFKDRSIAIDYFFSLFPIHRYNSLPPYHVNTKGGEKWSWEESWIDRKSRLFEKRQKNKDSLGQ